GWAPPGCAIVWHRQAEAHHVIAEPIDVSAQPTMVPGCASDLLHSQRRDQLAPARAWRHGRGCAPHCRRSQYLDGYAEAVTLAHALTLMVGLIRAQASLPHRIWYQNPQRQTVTRPKGPHFRWLSLGKSLGSKPE